MARMGKPQRRRCEGAYARQVWTFPSGLIIPRASIGSQRGLCVLAIIFGWWSELILKNVTEDSTMQIKWIIHQSIYLHLARPETKYGIAKSDTQPS